MLKILKSLPEFREALESKKFVACKENGQWQTLSRLSRSIRAVKTEKEGIPLALTAFQNCLNETEFFKLQFNASESTMQKQTAFYRQLRETGETVIRLYEDSENDEVRQKTHALAFAILQMQYRIQEENGGLGILDPDEVDEELLRKLEEKFEEFKANDEKYEHTEEQDYSNRLREICCYPALVEFILDPKHTKICKEYLNTTIRDNINIQLASQYHRVSEIFVETYLGPRCGAIGRELISVDLVKTNLGSDLKVANILVEKDKPVSLLDRHKVTHFSNGLNWKLERIYKDFREKEDEPGELEVTWNGIVPFNGHMLGPRIVKPKTLWQKFKISILRIKETYKYQKIDTTQPGWYEKTPILDIRSREYIENLYRGCKLDIQPGQWVKVLVATRRQRLDLVGSHGYTVLYQPIDDNNYRVYSFGAFPWHFPQNSREMAEFVANTVDATIAFDPNYLKSTRPKAAWAEAVDEEVAHEILKELGMHIKLGIIFQIAYENCAYFIYNLFCKVHEKMGLRQVPDFFRMDFLDTKPQGALKSIKKIFKQSPEMARPFLKLVFIALFRADRYKYVKIDGKRVKKSLLNSPFFKGKDLITFIPSGMHEKIKRNREEKKLNPKYEDEFGDSVICYGNYREQEALIDAQS